MSWPRHFSPTGGNSHERREALRKSGPTLRVLISNPYPQEDVNALPHVEADGLIDTGASVICIDKRVAVDLRLSRTGETNMIAVGASHPATIYAAMVEVPELDFKKFMRVTAPNGVRVAPRILLGRDFLQFFHLTYNGPDGMFEFHPEGMTFGTQHDFDE